MKSYSIKVLIVSLMVSGIAAITSCKDDNLIDPSTNTPPLLEKEMKISRINHFYKIDIPGESEWHVTHSPKWIGLLNRKGSAGERLQIFVQTNGEDNDRRDTIVVALADENSVRFPIHQLCEATDEENFEAGQIDDGDLKMTYGVGYGVDVIKPGDFLSYKYNVSNNSPFDFASLYNAINDLGEYDAMFDEPLYSSRFESVTGSSTSAMANQLGVNAGIEVGIKAFKFSVEAGYEKKSDSNERNMYAIQEVQHIVGSRYIRAGVLRYLAQNADTVLQETFRQCIEDLREDPSDKEAMQTIIDRYGTHIVTHGTLGGELKISLKMKVTSECDGSKIHAALGLSSKVVNVNGSFDMSDDEKQAASNTTFSLQAYGGRNVYSVAPGATFDSIMVKIKDPKLMNAWVSAIKNDSALALIDMQTMPIWDLMPTEALRDTLRNFVVNDYQRKIYGANFKPDLYRISGYDVNIEAPGRDSIYIPELDLAIVAERYICDDLSEDEFSTIIHSGPQGNVNYDRGFFVGSDTRLPCKIHRLKDNTLEKEVFDHITETSAVETLYADASGDITIATKSVDGMYMTTNFNHWVHDLGMLNKEWEVTSNVTVTGTTNYPVTIADGVTLTLDNATINNQIICNGNANIVLKDGTKNSVVTTVENKAAIQVGPSGTTLTISGNGELTAKGGFKGAGIGGSDNQSCGNIVINGGVITATSGGQTSAIGGSWTQNCGDITITNGTVTANAGQNCAAIGSSASGICGKIEISGGNITANGSFCAAAIGTGWKGTCSDITISGGTVKAVGGGRAAGIGTGCAGTCGNITINSSVTYVEATCGLQEDECEPIGYGDLGTCGNVTIEDESKVKQINPNIIDISTLSDGAIISGKRILYGTTNNKIVLEDQARVTFDGITIKNDVVCGRNVEIILKQGSTNTIQSGTLDSSGSDLTINGKGTLYVNGKSGQIGIGGTIGQITINDGNIYATGGEYSPGIGFNSGGSIIINGGNIVARGGIYGAGIGSGGRSYSVWGLRTSCSSIRIKGGTITAYCGGSEAASIGPGYNGYCGEILIYNTVTKVNAFGEIGRIAHGEVGSVYIEQGTNIERHYAN